MANLKEVRNRIASVGSTKQITSAMKMVSASKLRKAQNAITSLRPYFEKMNQMISNIGFEGQFEGVYSKRDKIDNVLLVVLTSNKGLCGGFNSNAIRATRKKIEEYYSLDKYIKVSVPSYGKKSSEFFKKQKGIEYLGEGDDIWEDLTFENVGKIAQRLMSEYNLLMYDKVEIIYNQFKNSATQYVITENYLPIEPLQTEDNANNNNYIFEPSRQQIIENVIPQALKVQLYRCFIDSFAAEHGARMTSMHKATDNAEGLLKDLKLSYNKARQAAITNEIIEICSGAEALKG